MIRNARAGLRSTGSDDCSGERWPKSIGSTKQRAFSTYGWHTDEGSRRQMVRTGQDYIREQKVEILCPHLISQLKTFIFDPKGKVRGGGGIA